MGKRVFGPLAGPLEETFRADLLAQGYRLSATGAPMAVLRDLSRWLAGRGLVGDELSEDRLEEFAADRRDAGRQRYVSVRWLAPVVAFLRAEGVVPPPPPAPEATGLELVLANYHDWLVNERDLAAKTVLRYDKSARLFLGPRVESAGGGSGVEGLSAADVTAFLLHECSRVSIGSAKGRVSELRSLLRFLHLQGLAPASLAAAVPGVAGWSGARLPMAPSAGQVAAMLEACDRSELVGRRDFAVLTLLARLGLRSAEVAGLELEDLDWRGGEIVIRGKGRRTDRLPLPVDVGDAMAAYLAGGRPQVACRRVFLRGRAPLTGIAAGSVSSIVRMACGRAGIAPVGAHRLRHGAAAEMLRQGAPLAEIGQVLRHRDLATTALYAKVDRAALLSVAKAWPAGVA